MADSTCGTPPPAPPPLLPNPLAVESREDLKPRRLMRPTGPPAPPAAPGEAEADDSLSSWQRTTATTTAAAADTEKESLILDCCLDALVDAVVAEADLRSNTGIKFHEMLFANVQCLQCGMESDRSKLKERRETESLHTKLHMGEGGGGGRTKLLLPVNEHLSLFLFRLLSSSFSLGRRGWLLFPLLLSWEKLFQGQADVGTGVGTTTSHTWAFRFRSTPRSI